MKKSYLNLAKRLITLMLAASLAIGASGCTSISSGDPQDSGSGLATQPAGEENQQPGSEDSSAPIGGDSSPTVPDEAGDNDGAGGQSGQISYEEPPEGWDYSFGHEFIYENGIQYVWERLDDTTKINLGEAMNAIRDVQVYCSLSVGFPREEAEDFLELLANCAMYYSYYESRFQLHVTDEGMVRGLTINYSVQYEDEAAERNRLLGEKLDEMIAGMPDGSDFEKIKYLHDTLVLNCTYSEDAVSPFTAFGSIVEGRATCQGYADGMHLLLSRAGFETMFATGEGSEPSIKHKWCYVRLDGEWYAIDPTWDDPQDKKEEDFIGYEYFLVTDELILRDHEKKYDSSYYEVPVAEGTELNYYRQVGYWAENEEDVRRILTEQAIAAASEGSQFIYLRMEDGEELADIYSPSMFEEILKEAAAQTGAAIDTGSWSRSLKEEIGTLTITIKYLD